MSVMKKIYLLSILMCIGSWGYAQTITLTYKHVSLTDQQIFTLILLMKILVI